MAEEVDASPPSPPLMPALGRAKTEGSYSDPAHVVPANKLDLSGGKGTSPLPPPTRIHSYTCWGAVGELSWKKALRSSGCAPGEWQTKPRCIKTKE